jgi:hypothetical protein
MGPGAPFRGWCGQRGEMHVSRQVRIGTLSLTAERSNVVDDAWCAQAERPGKEG